MKKRVTIKQSEQSATDSWIDVTISYDGFDARYHILDSFTSCLKRTGSDKRVDVAPLGREVQSYYHRKGEKYSLRLCVEHFVRHYGEYIR